MLLPALSIMDHYTTWHVLEQVYIVQIVVEIADERLSMNLDISNLGNVQAIISKGCNE